MPRVLLGIFVDKSRFLGKPSSQKSLKLKLQFLWRAIARRLIKNWYNFLSLGRKNRVCLQRNNPVFEVL
ncbi:hypothetical protein QUA00_12895 [Microcoleus sp. T2B6]|uniref:hypothetical protein n=1 Tax=Microcoleus sp. T2B6 TaxID=3055424 RepID=UPI002FD0193C